MYFSKTNYNVIINPHALTKNNNDSRLDMRLTDLKLNGQKMDFSKYFM